MFNSIKKIFGVSTPDIKKLMKDDAIIIDVRTLFEFKSGHIPGSRNISLDTLPSSIAKLKKLNKKIITVCRSGSRSATAKNMLVSAGIDVHDGGAWQNLKEVV